MKGIISAIYVFCTTSPVVPYIMTRDFNNGDDTRWFNRPMKGVEIGLKIYW